jgi:hypothetical protein
MVEMVGIVSTEVEMWGLTLVDSGAENTEQRSVFVEEVPCLSH